MKFKLNYLLIPLVVIIIAISGSLLSGDVTSEWYINLIKSHLTPPNFLFGIVWPILYLLGAISAVIFWNKSTNRSRNLVIGLFVVNGILNALWSYLFFGLHMVEVAFFEMIFLWLTILGIIVLGFKISRLASLLQIPYLVWVSFATYLTYMIITLN